MATEFAITRVRLSQVIELEKQGKPGAKAARHAVEQIDAYLAACQLGITVASIGLGALAEPAFEHLLEPLVGRIAPGIAVGLSLALALAIVTMLHVVLGELAPKSLAIARTTRTVLVVAPPMRAFYLVTKPLVDFFNWMGNWSSGRSASLPRARRDTRRTPRTSCACCSPRASVRASSRPTSGSSPRTCSSSATCARGRSWCRAATSTSSLSVTASRRRSSRASGSLHTRLPLCEAEDGLDDPVGVVNFKELLRLALDGVETDLTELARPLARVSESTLVDQVLREMRTRRQHMALVVDEYGTTVGLITLEDILEEIVGEFEEEEDGVHDADIRRDGDALLVQGSALLGEVEDELGIEIENAGEATIGGHLIELLGRVPEAGEVVELEGREVMVVAVDEARIETLRIPPAPDALEK